MILISTILLISSQISAQANNHLDLKLSPLQTQIATSDDYFCITYKPLSEDIYINKIEALPGVTRKYTHHIILNAFEAPSFEYAYKLAPVGESNGVGASYDTYNDKFSTLGGNLASYEDPYNCKHIMTQKPNSKSTVLYAWGMDANPLILPENSGFKVKKGWSLSIELHFLTKPPEGYAPGLRISLTEEKPKYLVGIWLLLSGNFKIPRMTANFPVDLQAKVPRNLTVFAGRVHAHQWSKVSTAYVGPDRQSSTHATFPNRQMIIQGMPHWTQEFYTRLPGPINLTKNQLVTARCVFSNNLDMPITVGSDAKDEMCNFYLLYIDTYENFQQLDVDWKPNMFLGDDSIPLSSYSVPDFAGYSGVKVEGAPKKPDFIAEVGMDISHKDMNMDMKMNTKKDYFYQGNQLKSASSTALDAKSNYLFVFHRAGRVWQQNTFNWQVITDPEDSSSRKEAGIWNGGEGIDKPTIKVLDAYTGQELANFGGKKRFKMPHGIFIDSRNEYLYITDVGNHAVYRTKFSNIGEYRDFSEQKTSENSPTFTFSPAVLQDTINWQTFGDDKFCMPTDISEMNDPFDPTGKKKYILISDGYCNKRIAVFDKDTGRFVRNLIHESFEVTHSVASFGHKACAVSREVGKIICFNLRNNDTVVYGDRGPESAEMRNQIGKRIFSIRKVNQDTLIGINGPDNYHDGIKPLIFTMDMKTGTITNKYYFKDMTNPHEIECDGKKVYVADIDQGIFASMKKGLVDWTIKLDDESSEDEDIFMKSSLNVNFREMDEYEGVDDSKSASSVRSSSLNRPENDVDDLFDHNIQVKKFITNLSGLEPDSKTDKNGSQPTKKINFNALKTIAGFRTANNQDFFLIYLLFFAGIVGVCYVIYQINYNNDEGLVGSVKMKIKNLGRMEKGRIYNSKYYDQLNKGEVVD